jgi:hypothetical protein
MFHAKNYNLIMTRHFIEMLELRQNNIVPDNDGIHTLMSTHNPVYIEKQTNDKFKLFYSIDLEYDLIVVLLASVNEFNAQLRIPRIVFFQQNMLRYCIENNIF